MTNKEWKIKNLHLNWGELLLKKENLIKEILTTEFKLNQIKEELLRYGISQTNSEMGDNKTEMGESDHLDNCLTHNSDTSIHKL